MADKKFINSKAEFIFVAPSKVLEMAEKLNAILRCSRRGLRHKGDKYAFDAVIEKYRLKDSALSSSGAS